MLSSKLLLLLHMGLLRFSEVAAQSLSLDLMLLQIPPQALLLRHLLLQQRLGRDPLILMQNVLPFDLGLGVGTSGTLCTQKLPQRLREPRGYAMLLQRQLHLLRLPRRLQLLLRLPQRLQLLRLPRRPLQLLLRLLRLLRLPRRLQLLLRLLQLPEGCSCCNCCCGCCGCCGRGGGGGSCGYFACSAV